MPASETKGNCLITRLSHIANGGFPVLTLSGEYYEVNVMVTVTSEGHKTRCLVTDGTHHLPVDTMPANGGEGAGFRPHDLLGAAVGSCLVIQLRMFAFREQIPLTGVIAEVEMDRSTPGKTVFRKHVEFTGDDLTEDDRKRLHALCNSCPVQNTLSAQMEFVLLEVI